MGIIDLDNRDILQINATIIAGALIFLTIYSFPLNVTAVSNRIIGIGLGIGVIAFFSESSYFVLSGKRPDGVSTMKLGFTYLLFGSIFFLITVLWSSVQQIDQTLSNVSRSLTNPSAPTFSHKSVHYILNNTASAPHNITSKIK
jgi:hypothetical protein